MGFEVYGASESSGAESKINWDELHNYVVETANLQEKETLTGYISGIVDLGKQDQPDSENPYKGTAEEEEAIIADKPATYFKDGIDSQTRKPCRLICWPNKSVQSVAVSVDFPSIVIDKGIYFGESNPQPLRLWLGDSFYLQNIGMVVGRVTPIKANTKLGGWSFDVKHLFYKMAIACKLIKTGELFGTTRIDELLGKSFQFDAQVFMRDGKDGKQYFTEKVRFSTGLGRGMTEAEVVNKPFLIQFNSENTPEALKNLRAHVTNTIKQAKNYEGSAIQKQLEAKTKPAQKAKPTVDEDHDDAPAVKSAPKPAAAKLKAKPVVVQDDADDEDTDLPF